MERKMENNMKKRYSVTVAGIELNLLTEESEDFLRKTADGLSSRIKEITRASFSVSKLDAAILCALDSLGEAEKSAEKIRSLEAEIAVLEMDTQNMREELDSLRDRFSPSKPLDRTGVDDKRKNIESFLDKKING